MPAYLHELQSVLCKSLQDSGMPKSLLTDRLIKDLLKANDNLNKVEFHVDKVLQQSYAGLHPKFEMGRTKQEIARTATSARRVRNVERIGTRRRIEDLGEKIGI